MANTLKLSRNGAVGFIVWLGLAGSKHGEFYRNLHLCPPTWWPKTPLRKCTYANFVQFEVSGAPNGVNRRDSPICANVQLENTTTLHVTHLRQDGVIRFYRVCRINNCTTRRASCDALCASRSESGKRQAEKNESGRHLHRPNENKMSDGGLGRASRGLARWKSF